MNVSNGTPGQNTGDNSGFNTQPNQSIQRPQQSMGNTQQPNLSKPNNQMGVSTDRNGKHATEPADGISAEPADELWSARISAEPTNGISATYGSNGISTADGISATYVSSNAS